MDEVDHVPGHATVRRIEGQEQATAFRCRRYGGYPSTASLPAGPTSMNLSEVLSVLWHRKLLVIGVLAVAIGAAVGALKLVTPVYESTSTLALQPQNLTNDLAFFQTIDAIVPIYATAAESNTTLDAARKRNGGHLGDISVRTFQGAPIFKIDARDTNRSIAQSSAQQVTDTLRRQVAAGEVGIRSLRVAQIDRPALPGSPVFPNTKLTLAVAVLLGLGLGYRGRAAPGEPLEPCADARRAGGCERPPGVRRASGRACAARRGVSPELLTSSSELRTINEALRDLRTNLAYAGNGKIKTVTVTSPEGSHGKSTISLGLAVAIARSGANTLLVDADLRRGRIAEMLEIPRVPGLYEAMSATRLDGGVIRETAVPNLQVMTGGRIVSDPGEVLSTRFSQLLEKLEESYDAIVLDTTPLVPVNDARVISSLSTATLIVARSGRATRASIKEAVDRLALIAVTPTAAVLNMSKSRGARTYYGTPEAAEERTVVRGRL